jgi:hypothetical protein
VFALTGSFLIMKYWITKEIAATTRKIGMTFSKEYEQTLMQ